MSCSEYWTTRMVRPSECSRVWALHPRRYRRGSSSYAAGPPANSAVRKTLKAKQRAELLTSDSRRLERAGMLTCGGEAGACCILAARTTEGRPGRSNAGMEEREDGGGAVRVGMVWGGIGGVVGVLASLPGSLIGILVSGFIGVSCGRRAAAAGKRSGALSGLIGGAVAAPGYVLGSTLGALLAARLIGAAEIAATH